jgi:hypothetical protein
MVADSYDSGTVAAEAVEALNVAFGEFKKIVAPALRIVKSQAQLITMYEQGGRTAPKRLMGYYDPTTAVAYVLDDPDQEDVEPAVRSAMHEILHHNAVAAYQEVGPPLTEGLTEYLKILASPARKEKLTVSTSYPAEVELAEGLAGLLGTETLIKGFLVDSDCIVNEYEKVYGIGAMYLLNSIASASLKNDQTLHYTAVPLTMRLDKPDNVIKAVDAICAYYKGDSSTKQRVLTRVIQYLDLDKYGHQLPGKDDDLRAAIEAERRRQTNLQLKNIEEELKFEI